MFILYVLYSIIIILGLHFGYNYLIDNYTIKKIKYLGRFENQKYQEILQELKNKDEKNDKDFFSNFDKNEMENDLLNLIK
jgi:hypothetical protein